MLAYLSCAALKVKTLGLLDSGVLSEVFAFFAGAEEGFELDPVVVLVAVAITITITITVTVGPMRFNLGSLDILEFATMEIYVSNHFSRRRSLVSFHLLNQKKKFL